MENKNEQERLVQNSQKGTERGQSGFVSTSVIRRLPKTHQDHWLGRLRKRTYLGPDGKTQVEVPAWQVRLKKAGRESWFNLQTSNQAAAAKKAKEIFTFLEANGWDLTLAKYKPEQGSPPRLNLTIGDFLETVEDTGYLRLRTFFNYRNCLRTIVGEAFGVRGDESKYDYRAGGNKTWTEKIDRIRLERVVPARILTWQKTRLRKAGHSPVAIASAKRTCNSYVRCARSLFSAEILKRLKDVKLPEPLPFKGVELFESGSQKYVSKISAQALIAAAKTELKSKDPEAYKAFLLGLFAGMRKGEIDLVEWGMIDWDNHAIKLEETEWLHLKTTDSAGEITVDPQVLSELKGFMTPARSRFVIDSSVSWKPGKKAKKRTRIRPPRNDSARRYYRCEPVFERLTKWLRSKGVRSNKPIHELRKEVGALIATEHGIFAASRFLRHSDITTTARHYVEHKARISVGLGKLLDTGIKPAEPVMAKP
jgi:integrase